MRITLALFALLAGLSGCDVEFESNGDFISPEGTAGIPPGGTVGATPGGAQDIGYVRQTIEAGRVPLGDDWLVEGLLSEHDFPVAGADCDDLLCIRPGLGKALDPHTGETNWWVHLGMTTGIAVESFQRPPMDLVVLIDTSAAMAIDQAETNEAVTRLLPHLTMADRLAVVTFDDDVHVLHPLQTVAEPDALARQVTALTAQGGWHFNAGLAAALDQFQGPPDPTRMRRIIIMSCDYPNPDGAFAEQVTQAEDAAIGLSIFGVLLGPHPDLARMLGDTRGGVFAFLHDLAATVRVFDDEFEFMVTPVAYDLTLDLQPNPSLKIATMAGLPAGDNGAARATVKTVFFSKRKGTIVARLRALEPVDGDDLGTLRFAYAPNPALGFPDPHEEEFALALQQSAEPIQFQGAGVRKAAALVNLVESAAHACTQWHAGQRAAAIAHLEQLLDYLRAEREALADAALDAEIELIERLLDNMS